MPGVTETGFEIKRLADILTDAEANLAAVVDPVTGDTLQPSFSPADPTMQVVQVPLDAVALAWELAEVVYGQFDPSKATGAPLSGLVQLNGLTRQPATPSTVTLALGGTPGAVIPAGQLVADANNLHRWTTDSDVTLNGSGTGTTGATCVDAGPVTAAPTSIVTPVTGWASITPGTVSAGRLEETSSELRTRRARSTMAPASSPVESIYSNLANLPGVTYCRVYQNNTLTADARGIPAKSVGTVIVGGADLAIAQTLLARTGVTSNWAGNSSLTLYDALNEPYVVRWSRPVNDPIYLDIHIQVINSTVFPVNGPQQIKDAIIAYAAGGAPALGVTDGFSDTGFPPGVAVVRSRLYTPLNFVPGHRVVSLKLGTAPSPTGEADIPVLFDHVAQFLTANISITVDP